MHAAATPDAKRYGFCVRALKGAEPAHRTVDAGAM